MCFFNLNAMINQKCFERLFYRLLAVETCVIKYHWFYFNQPLRTYYVMSRFIQPLVDIVFQIIAHKDIPSLNSVRTICPGNFCFRDISSMLKTSISTGASIALTMA